MRKKVSSDLTLEEASKQALDVGLSIQEVLSGHPEWERNNPLLVETINRMTKAALVHYLKDALWALEGMTKIVIPVGEHNAAERSKWQTILEHSGAIRAFGQRQLNLAEGRNKGAKAQRAYAQEMNQLIVMLNADLLKNPLTARWSLDKRATHIEGKLTEWDKKQRNGKPYTAATIKKKITGKA